MHDDDPPKPGGNLADNPGMVLTNGLRSIADVLRTHALNSFDEAVDDAAMIDAARVEIVTGRSVADLQATAANLADYLAEVRERDLGGHRLTSQLADTLIDVADVLQDFLAWREDQEGEEADDV